MVKENLEKVVRLRHWLHMHPELSMMETKTSGAIMQFLQDSTDLQVTDCGGWCYAVKKGTAGGRKIAFRADMDALPIGEGDILPWHSLTPGVSHKCGHDGHCAALCGLALELDRMETEQTVYLIFQPGEEIGKGGELCKEILHEEGIEEIYAFHNLSGYPAGSIVFREGLTQPASEGLRICFRGKTSHASAPEQGNNPAQVIAGTVLYAMELADSMQEEMAMCTVTGIRLGTGDFGISPGDGELCLTLRAEQDTLMKEMEAAITRHVRGVCGEAGIHVDISIHDYFPETRNDSASLARILHAAKKAGMHTIRMEKLWRASEDFGWYLKECPGALVYIGNGIDYPALHTVDYDFNDAILETAVRLFRELVRVC